MVLRGTKLCRVANFYAAVPPGRLVAVLGSSGLLEITITGGSAAEGLRLSLGDKVEIRNPKV